MRVSAKREPVSQRYCLVSRESEARTHVSPMVSQLGLCLLYEVLNLMGDFNIEGMPVVRLVGGISVDQPSRQRGGK